MITVVDYGMGNIRSIVNMLKRVGHEAILSADAKEIRAADKIILPGVGAYDAGMANIEQRGLREALDEKARGGTPFLGICLGMELMMDGSEEGSKPGLGWIRGRCVRFNLGESHPTLKVPHMRWNTAAPSHAAALFKEMDEDAAFYFVHSYHVVCEDAGDSATTTAHGIEFTSAIESRNLFGTQFHPEKSHRHGMQVMKNFAEL